MSCVRCVSSEMSDLVNVLCQCGCEEPQPHLEGQVQRTNHLLQLLLLSISDVHVLDVVSVHLSRRQPLLPTTHIHTHMREREREREGGRMGGEREGGERERGGGGRERERGERERERGGRERERGEREREGLGLK